MTDDPDTRERILTIALELFAAQGYAGTSIAHITGRLGTSKAALYYHFGSKAEILDALLAKPFAAYARLVESGPRSPDDLLAAVIDTTAESHDVANLIANDPSARAVLRERTRQLDADEINEALLAELAGPRPSVARRVRAHAAYAVAKQATLTLLSATGRITPATRVEILAAALRALGNS
ncbi:helix-turn-helix domain containing protein [Amycolatopsis cynarae]|uniref:Helix-turn-helix domain containing protein n=1 Tax=Amycolatopsis cynarae TaxID=2995223 RepID=A0ABY7B5Y4_9PSEU|nr:TetR/AcrR family transcriptional regulator [Amycolatopsis sp. HUAS 11-8]WAL66188.1 helix-turn-helix domain containing protein [Amycolatopsis sp. HUAS 11-8]